MISMMTRNKLLNVTDLLDELLDFPGWSAGSINAPEAEVKDNTLVLRWDVPGSTKEQFEVSTDDNVIIVKGTEGRYKDKVSKVRINRDYNLQSIDATLKDGVLTAVIPTGKNVTRNKVTIK